jgi:tetratricopeptide (TPR) repeat protein
MHQKKIIFSTLFLLLFSLGINGQIRLALTWEVVNYDLTATLPQNFNTDRDLDVQATLTLKNIKNRGASKLTMRISEAATVSTVKVNGATTDFEKGLEKIGGNQNLQRVIVSLPSVAAGKNVTVSVNYKVNVKANSGLSALSPAGSQFLPLSHWYPTPTSWYFNGGGDYAPFNLRVNGTDGQTVLSSGVESTGGFQQKLFGQPFFTTGQWDKVSSSDVDVYVPKGMNVNPKIATEIATLASEAKSFAGGLLGKTFDTPIRIIGVSRGSGFSDSGVLFVDESIFQRQKLDSQTVMNVSEAIAKTWLGNKVKVEGEAYGVIREGLSRYIATEFLEQKYGKDIANLERLRQRIKYAGISLRDAPLNVVSPVDAYYYTSTANKGAMIWKFLSKSFGNDLFKIVQQQAADGELNLSEIRQAFSSQKEYLDYIIDRVTEMNLMIGLPQQNGNQAKVALRNMGEIDVIVDLVATTADGQELVNETTIKAKSFGEATFNTTKKIVRIEVDKDKLYPQTDYQDDIAPREIGENDALVFIKREFDRQRFDDAEKNAEAVLKVYPIFDDARILLARAQLAQNKISVAKNNFEEVLKLELPSAQSIAWANVGLGEIAQKGGKNSEAREFYNQAIKTDSDLGATLMARRGRLKTGTSTENQDPAVKAFFDAFDKAVAANNKSEIDSLILNGEIARFASSVAGQAQAWKTDILHIDKIDNNNMLIEVNMSVKLLNRENETGLAVYRLSRDGNGWKLSDVEIFEVS